LIREKLDVPVQLEKGGHGQFDVEVNGRPVLSRKGGLIAKLVNRPWPAADEILTAVNEGLRIPG
jgi:hypothetical protein